ESLGYRVEHVQNFTDVEDKIILHAQQRKLTPEALTAEFIEDYFAGMDALNVMRATRYPLATQEIPRMLELIQKLIDEGYAYPAQGSVYFRVEKAVGYGSLSHRSLEGMMAGARVEPGEGKEHPMDFALWKAAKPGEPAWDSPWGKGRPGWHIECSAMALAYLGETIDIHGGGQDLIFPHHENEAAQSESYTHKRPFARFWVHNGLLQLGSEKMSKSLGNLVTLKDALSRHSSDALRLFFLSSYYRAPLTYTEEAVEAMERGAERLRTALREAPASGGAPLDASQYRQRFLAALDDDLNTPQASAALFDLARETNRARDEGMDVSAAQQTLRELGGLLGLTFKARESKDAVAVEPFIQLLIETRKELRAAKQYALADAIRNKLAALGVALEDTPQGTVWRMKG
ncbi:MAG: cysteine--tRNA ligase, partial [Chloroflexota bacterium]|nr:cysteine--tRNA ligase [Chloroflexota bacterium]